MRNNGAGKPAPNPKLVRIARQLEAYGLNKLQTEVVLNLMMDYFKSVCIEAESKITDELICEIFTKTGGFPRA